MQDLKQYPKLLTIAGSDPIGGAGIQADIKVCNSLKVYAMSVISCITAQNTLGVQHSHKVPINIFKKQLSSVFNDVSPDAVKIGLLPSKSHVEIVADFLVRNKIENVVIDPVLSPTFGKMFVDSPDETLKSMCENLFPIAKIVTPNIPEFHQICKALNADHEDRLNAFQKIGANNMLLKGGHSDDKSQCKDIFFSNENSLEIFTHKRIDTPNLHGTGCVLSTAIGCYLANRHTTRDAVEKAEIYLIKAIEKGKDFSFGHGSGPLYLF